MARIRFAAAAQPNQGVAFTLIGKADTLHGMRYPFICTVCLIAAAAAFPAAQGATGAAGAVRLSETTGLPGAAGLPGATQSKAKLAFGVPILQEDHSLTLDAYEQAGVPPIDQPWGLAEYQAAAKALTALAQKDARQLPRKNSRRSGRLFVHLFKAEHFPNPEAATTRKETEAMLAELRELSGGPLLKITDAYLLSLDQGFSLPNETCAAIGFTAEVLPIAHTLAGQATAQGRPAEPARTAALEESTVNAFVSAVSLLRHVGDEAVGAKGAMLGRIVPAYLKVRRRISIPADTKIQLAVDLALAWEVSEPIQTQLRLMQNK